MSSAAVIAGRQERHRGQHEHSCQRPPRCQPPLRCQPTLPGLPHADRDRFAALPILRNLAGRPASCRAPLDRCRVDARRLRQDLPHQQASGTPRRADQAAQPDRRHCGTASAQPGRAAAPSGFGGRGPRATEPAPRDIRPDRGQAAAGRRRRDGRRRHHDFHGRGLEQVWSAWPQRRSAHGDGRRARAATAAYPPRLARDCRGGSSDRPRSDGRRCLPDPSLHRAADRAADGGRALRRGRGCVVRLRDGDPAEGTTSGCDRPRPARGAARVRRAGGSARRSHRALGRHGRRAHRHGCW